MSDLCCAFSELVKAALRYLLLRHGCSSAEAASFEVRGGRDLGANTYLAAVCGPDGRELFRIYSLEDLDRLVTSPGECRYLAGAIKRTA